MMRCMFSVMLVLACQEAELPYAVERKTADMYVPELYDPYKLPSFLGGKDAYKEKKFEGTESIVPKVDIILPTGKGDVHYEIQRCPKGVKLETTAGVDPFTHNYGAAEGQKHRDYLYVWGQAAAGACTLLGRSHISMPFVDEFGTEEVGGTDDFNFFYLVRPCLYGKNSIYRGRRTCSYAFARTQLIENYTHNLSEKELEHGAEFAHLRARLEHRMGQMASVVREKAHYLQRCELREAKKNAFKRRLAGIAKVYLTVVATATAAVLSGGTAAFLAGSAAIQLGDKLFSGVSNATLNCPIDVYNTRIEELREDATKTVERIGEIRVALAELDLEGKKEPPPENVAQGLGLEEKCVAQGLGKNCLGEE